MGSSSESTTKRSLWLKLELTMNSRKRLISIALFLNTLIRALNIIESKNFNHCFRLCSADFFSHHLLSLVIFPGIYPYGHSFLVFFPTRHMIVFWGEIVFCIIKTVQRANSTFLISCSLNLNFFVWPIFI